ncbi:zinc finger protein 239 isoform X2 [Nematolebias whitei]|uniref:zinc finger protein 239 isoform X2 n=1 Tax=Nematolebias whitei TaxID=451745 RepID=UPI00189BCCC1|nr:zinc finger protein 239 isoform X2 [Nematolebias whitei]
MDFCWNPLKKKLHEVKLEDEASADRQEPELPQVKEEQVVLKQPTGTFMDKCEECDLGEPEPNGHQLLSHVSPVAESPDQKRSEPVESEPAGSSELNPKTRRHGNRSPSGSTGESRSECATACVVCEVCGRAFRNKYKMKVHTRTHTGEKPHPCPVCSKTFRVSRDLTIHTRTHTGEKPYICKVCGRGFLHSGVLAVHVRTHTGEKPYICKVCGRSFRQSSTLSVHLRTHTGEKPFSCPICSKGFSRNDNRIIHMRTHAGEARGSAGPGSAGTGAVGVRSHAGLKPISCETCGRSFTHRSNLTVHLRTHTGEKPYSCARCGKAFRHHSSWSIHTRTHQNL